MITTIAGNGNEGLNGDNKLATECELNYPDNVFVSDCGNVYIADHRNHRVVMVDSQTGMLKTIAGTGHAGYSGDVPFDFEKYPHIGPTKHVEPFSKRDGQFVKACHDVIIIAEKEQ